MDTLRKQKLIIKKQIHRKLTDKQKRDKRVKHRETQKAINAMREHHLLKLATRDLMECW